MRRVLLVLAILLATLSTAHAADCTKWEPMRFSEGTFTPFEIRSNFDTEECFTSNTPLASGRAVYVPRRTTDDLMPIVHTTADKLKVLPDLFRSGREITFLIFDRPARVQGGEMSLALRTQITLELLERFGTPRALVYDVQVSEFWWLNNK